ncbi:hypothetical protein [Ferrimicrobium sp.]|uniref:hypothetical protein n=1 Tax=Ferrimicrobium sp. TaxID=2926050 RepID=UPI00261C8E79|nr:hypothetical protein [Ferrimicrobium sp.]
MGQVAQTLASLGERTNDTLSVGERPMVVMDRGNAAEANIALLVERDYSYLVITREASAKVDLKGLQGRGKYLHTY